MKHLALAFGFLPLMNKTMFCFICHPGSPRRGRTAVTEPAKWRSQVLRSAPGCSWALCRCHFSRVRVLHGARMEWVLLVWEHQLVSSTESVLSTEKKW